MSSIANKLTITNFHLKRIGKLMVPLAESDIKDTESTLLLESYFEEYKHYYEDWKRFVDQYFSEDEREEEEVDRLMTSGAEITNIVHFVDAKIKSYRLAEEEKAKKQTEAERQAEEYKIYEETVDKLKKDLATMRTDVDEMIIEQGLVYIGEAADRLIKANFLDSEEDSISNTDEDTSDAQAKLRKEELVRFCRNSVERKNRILAKRQGNLTVAELDTIYTKTLIAMNRALQGEAEEK